MTYRFTYHGQPIVSRVPESTFRNRVSNGKSIKEAAGPKVPASIGAARGGRKSRGNPLCQFSVLPRGM